MTWFPGAWPRRPPRAPKVGRTTYCLLSTFYFLLSTPVLPEGHQALIPPELAFFQGCFGKAFPALLFDFVEHGALPSCRVAPGPNEAVVHGAVTRYVITDTARRVEVNRFKGTHETPALSESFAYSDIDVLNRTIPGTDQVERFVEDSGLKPVHDKAVQLALHHYRCLPNLFHDRLGPIHCLGGCPGSRHQFNRSDQVGRIQRMRDQPAVGSRQVGTERGGHDPGSRAGQNRVRSRQLIESFPQASFRLH